MRRELSIAALLVCLILPLAHRSLAAGSSPPTSFHGVCFSGPYNTVVPCATATTPAPVTPTKLLTISSGSAGPNGTTAYAVRLTSKLACFGLGEPIALYALGSPEAAALTALTPPGPGERHGVLQVAVDPTTGTADLSLEVFRAVVQPAGLELKAVWPQEGVERIVPVIAPGTVTATAAPAPMATALPTATVTAPAMFVQACLDHLVVPGLTLGAGALTLYGRTLPGATCVPTVSYYFKDGTYFRDATRKIDGLHATPRVAGSDGLVSYPFSANTAADYGIGTVTCTSPTGAQAAACRAFLIAQKSSSEDTSTLLTAARAAEVLERVKALTTASCPSGGQ